MCSYACFAVIQIWCLRLISTPGSETQGENMKRLCRIITDEEMLPNNTILSITEEEMAEILPNYDRALNDCQN